MTREMIDLAKIKAAAEIFIKADKPIWMNPQAVLELITLLKETQADLAHANSILIKIEKLLEGVEYRGDYAEGVRVLVAQQAAQIEAFKTELKQVDTLRELLVADHVNELAEQAGQIEKNLTEIYRLDSGWHEANVKCLEQAARITLLEAAEEDVINLNSVIRASVVNKERIEGRLEAAECEAEKWERLFGQVAKELKCLPSSFIDGNSHVIRVATEAMKEKP